VGGWWENKKGVTKMVVKNKDYKMEDDPIVNGRHLYSGYFAKKNTIGQHPNSGRPAGSRNEMTMKMLANVAARSNDGLSVEEIIMDIAQDPKEPSDLRFRAAAKIADIVYPKSASVEVEIDNKESLTPEKLQEQLQKLLDKSKIKIEEE
jgi:hypothetical protein